MSFSYRVTAEYHELFTRNSGTSAFPLFQVPLKISGRAGSPSSFRLLDFLWDSGASNCVIDRKIANDHGIVFDDTLDRVEAGMEGLGGNQEGERHGSWWIICSPFGFSTPTASFPQPGVEGASPDTPGLLRLQRSRSGHRSP